MDKIDELLTRGVDKVYPSKEALEEVLRGGKKLTLYLGVDPSGDKLHIGHAVVLRKLRQLQNLGHHVILLIGDFTGMIGDPTDKSAARKKLTREQVLENAKTYRIQASKILNFQGPNPIEIKYNSQWLSKLNFTDIVELTSFFTVQQMIERDMFQKRIKEGKEISLVEFLYPVMVAYDALAMKVDLEVGGSDQTFNMLAGKRLITHHLNKDKFVLTVPLLTDNKGVKIGKSEGNVIALTAKPNDFYAMIMSLSDDVIIRSFEYLTDIPMEEVNEMEKQMKVGVNPINIKKKLAFTLTQMLNDEKSAATAQKEFESIHQTGDISWMTSSLSSLPTIALHDISKQGIASGASIAIGTVPNYVKSNSEFKRLENQKAIDIMKPNNDVIKVEHNKQINIKDGDILKIGKKTYLKIKK